MHFSRQSNYIAQMVVSPFVRLLTVVSFIALATIVDATTVWANPLFGGADPDILVDQHKYWIYSTTEPDKKNVLYAYSSEDLVHWTKSAPLLAFADIRWLNDDKAPSHELWAPGIFKDGDKYFLYYAVGPQHPTPSRIGVAVARKPEGPFVDSGAPLITGDTTFEAIDPMVFKDPKSGKVYLYCGGSAGSQMRVYELTNDLLHVAQQCKVDTPEKFTEGPFMHMRGNQYYLSYSFGKWNDESYCVEYSTSSCPLGPWTYRGQLTRTDTHHVGPGHHAIFQNPYSGDWLIAYHRWNNAKRDGKMPEGRSVSIEKVDYDKSGLIKPVQMTDNDSPVSPLGKPAFKRLNDRLSQYDFGVDDDGLSNWAVVLSNKSGMSAAVTTYGATLLELRVPDKNAVAENIVLGFDNLVQYERQSPYFGATIGRYANRIAGAAFDLQGRHYMLAANNGPNTLHGGAVGFDKRRWDGRLLEIKDDRCSVEFSRTSRDGEEGFPGDLRATVIYTLTDDNKLILEYSATTSAPTPINLTNHAYFNLSGAGGNSILNHKLTINANRFTPVDSTLIPTGAIQSVKQTAMDFSQGKTIGDDMSKVPGGYDHNFIIDGRNDQLKEAARLEDPISGRIMTMYTTEPGVQFYSGNFLDASICGNGGVYKKHSGLCLEAQHYPDSPHHPNFPNVVLMPGKVYKQTTIYAFSHQ
jgi:aldose 1-epimerase